MKRQVFISYRRDGGDTLAQLLYERLTARGFSVFYDIEKLRSGPFNKALYKAIEECDDFILVLPAQALDRCIYEEDWVRKEILHAMEHQKNIIPVIGRGFGFPLNMPPELALLPSLQRVSFETMDYLDARMDMLVSMLRSKPHKVSASGNSQYSMEDKLIRNVCSLGSCDFQNPFPSDGVYSEVINRDTHPVIYFHITTTFFNAERIRCGMRIYDANDLLVLDSLEEFDWKPTYCRVSRSWVLRGQDGSFVKSGIYRAEFWINDSAIYEYHFKIMSSNFTAPHSVGGNQDQDTQKILLRRVENKLSRPKGFGLFLLLVLGYFLIMVNNDEIIALLGIGFLFGGMIGLIRYTKKHLWNNWLGATLLCSFFAIPYGVYLLFTTINCLFHRDQLIDQRNSLR